MTHVDALVAKSELHFGGQLEQAQEVGHGGAFLADALAEAFLCEVVLVDELAECKGYLNGVEVLALDILDQGHLGELAVVGRANIGRHRCQSGFYGGAVASFAGDYLIGIGPGFT